MAGVVTLLFTDLVGSTGMLDELCEDAGEQVRRTHFRLLRDAVTAAGGEEVKNLGDGLIVAFASPFRAVGCATAIHVFPRRTAGPTQRSPVMITRLRDAAQTAAPPVLCFGLYLRVGRDSSCHQVPAPNRPA